MPEEFEYRRYCTEGLLRKLQRWPEVTRYFDDCKLRGLKPGTIEKNLGDVLSLCRWLNHSLTETEPEELRAWCINERELGRTEQTIAHRMNMARLFLRFAGREDLAEAVPRIVVHAPRVDPATMEDARILFSSCKSPAENILVLLLVDTGCRIGEILTLRKRDIIFDCLGAYIVVNGKTGQRAVRLVRTAPIMKIAARHLRDGNDLVLGGMKYAHALLLFGRASNRAGRHIHAHMFRHAKATEMLKAYPEAIVKKFMGWSPGSRMPLVYGHITSRDVDMALFGYPPQGLAGGPWTDNRKLSAGTRLQVLQGG